MKYYRQHINLFRKAVGSLNEQQATNLTSDYANLSPEEIAKIKKAEQEERRIQDLRRQVTLKNLEAAAKRTRVGNLSQTMGDIYASANRGDKGDEMYGRAIGGLLTLLGKGSKKAVEVAGELTNRGISKTAGVVSQVPSAARIAGSSVGQATKDAAERGITLASQVPSAVRIRTSSVGQAIKNIPSRVVSSLGQKVTNVVAPTVAKLGELPSRARVALNRPNVPFKAPKPPPTRVASSTPPPATTRATSSTPPATTTATALTRKNVRPGSQSNTRNRVVNLIARAGAGASSVPSGVRAVLQRK